MAFRLLEDRVAVIADEISETNQAGLYVPDGGREQLHYGTVAIVGLGRRTEYRGDRVGIDVKVGDRVFWSRYSGSDITIGDTEYKVLAAREIVGIVDDEDA